MSTYESTEIRMETPAGSGSDFSFQEHSIIFLDIDGVLNCQLYYESDTFRRYQVQAKNSEPFSSEENRMQHYVNQICEQRVRWLNDLCRDVNALVVISSSWRIGKSVEKLQEIMNRCGGTFKIVDKTPYTGYERGTEISAWLKKNIKPETWGCHYYDFRRYVIIDDDSDMLLKQWEHFFQTDNYSGLTPTTCYKIRRYLTGQTFHQLS